MSGTVTNGLPSRPLRFAEMGTYSGENTEVLLTPFWAWTEGNGEQLVISVVCTLPGRISFLGFDAATEEWNTVFHISDFTDVTVVSKCLEVIEQWLFERYPLAELVAVNTNPMDLLTTESSLES